MANDLTLFQGEEWENADSVYSPELVDDKDAVIGVPLGITKATFRKANFPNRDYVSLEAINAQTNEPVVINDGSTGIRRQIVNYLALKGLIEEPADPDAPLVTGDDALSFDIRLIAKKGVRKSDYTAETPDGPIPATTYYLD